VNGLQRVHPNDVVVPTTVDIETGVATETKPPVVAAASQGN